MSKVFVFGVDGMPPQLVFDNYIEELPNIRMLVEKGAYGRIKSTDPPSTILAWSAFCSGRDPGELGVYSYTRKPKDPFEDAKLVSSTMIKQKMLWDMLSEKGKRCIILNVPLTYPAKKINGVMVTDFLTPDFDSNCVYPENFKEKIPGLAGGEYMFDVSEFIGYKSIDPHKLLELTYKMTEMHIKVAKYLFDNEKWDFFMCVIIGTDRLHHMLWKYTDETHPEYDKELKDSLKNFYKYIDKELGYFIGKISEDTAIIVSSDHGMVQTKGKINMNDWLIKEGYLTLKEEYNKTIMEKPSKLKLSMIDWSKTKAYEVGAYQGRIYINKKGKEQFGTVGEKEYNTLKLELKKKLLDLKGMKGEKLDTKVLFPEEIYKKGFDDEAFDLLVYFDDLKYSVNPDVGNKGLYSDRTTLGADSAGHHPYGTFIISGNKVNKKGDMGIVDIIDVAPTILNLLGITAPENLQGSSIIR
jgi:predicted AlkP superfamily phosphohydrolase/phosphomutase